ncbi:hypothetical protein M885DRAFT_403524, partial [Pelagophyceae sp. CCMP2097]
WDADYLRLSAYREAAGDCAVPSRFVTADGTTLGLWVANQRKAYKANGLTPERVEQLDALAFRQAYKAVGWGAHFELLETYQAQHGDCNVSRNFVAADGNRLGRWVSWQRKVHKAGNMPPDRIERLENISFVWRVLAGGWDAHFELLTAYQAAHGDCAVP